jgi:hypothetical protein
VYLYLGGDQMLLLDEVLAILRADLARDGPTREMVQSLRARGKLVLLPGGPPRSLVLTATGAYLSPLSTMSVLRRVRAWFGHRGEDAFGRAE